MRITEVSEHDLVCPYCGRHEFSDITDATAWCQTCHMEISRTSLVRSPAASVWYDVTGAGHRRFGTLKHPLGRPERVAVAILQIECLGERATFTELHRQLKPVYAATAVDHAVWWLVDHDVIALQSTVGDDPDRTVWFTVRPHRRFDIGRLHAYDAQAIAAMAPVQAAAQVAVTASAPL